MGIASAIHEGSLAREHSLSVQQGRREQERQLREFEELLEAVETQNLRTAAVPTAVMIGIADLARNLPGSSAARGAEREVRCEAARSPALLAGGAPRCAAPAPPGVRRPVRLIGAQDSLTAPAEAKAGRAAISFFNRLSTPSTRREWLTRSVGMSWMVVAGKTIQVEARLALRSTFSHHY